MKIYVGITDRDWFDQLKKDNAKEANFWQPGGKKQFKALQPNELFLFKQHAGDGGKICGGGFFVMHRFLPIDLAWDAFGRANGMPDSGAMRQRIEEYRKSKDGESQRSEIGCIVLTQPFFLEKKDYIDEPKDWSRSIVSGKIYDTAEKLGAHLFDSVRPILEKSDMIRFLTQDPSVKSAPLPLELGAFKIRVAEAYHNSCAITGEQTFPALEVMHIKPVSSGGTNAPDNGLLLRADLAALFSAGQLTIDAEDLRVRVSPMIRQRYNGGLNYYLMDGHKIAEPECEACRPSRDLLSWHNKDVFMN